MDSGQPQAKHSQAASHLHLPAQPTPFIGRDKELAKIAGRLTNPACRLLTLIGVGGIGKTRLAIEAATVCQAGFAGGIYFVPLQPVQTLDFLPFAIADALQFSLAGQTSPLDQLCDFLQDRVVLLVLDNFEHLLGDGQISQLADLLAAAPQLNLLVTSREALHLREEWLYPIEGLPFPAQGVSVSGKGLVDDFAAIALFVERAQQVRHDFSTEQDPAALIRICQLVAGMPLALELAAAWAKNLTCAEIAAEIQGGLDFLSTRLHNVPERHRSIQTVFDHTCQQLNEKERAIYAYLSVFRGGFDRTAAGAIAGASLSHLSTFVDKSLLRWSPDGRYQMHELLRQYAAEHLAESTEGLVHIQNLHCAYYVEFLQKEMLAPYNGSHVEGTVKTEADLKNVRAAWQWAVQHNKLAAMQKAIKPLANFYQCQGRYTEALSTFEKTVDLLREQGDQALAALALADNLMVLSFFYLRFGRIDEAEAVLTEIHTIYRRLKVEVMPGFVTHPDTMLGIVALVRGDFVGAAQLAQNVLADGEKHPHPSNQMMAYHVLAQTALVQGQYAETETFAYRSIEAAQAIGERWFMAYPLNTLGDVAVAGQDYALARQHYEASYTIRQEFHDAEGMAVALNHLSNITLNQADYQEAKRLFTESLDLYQTTNDKGGLATSYRGLGVVALAQDEYDTARQRFFQALQIAAAIDYVALLLTLLVGLGELLCRVGRPEDGIVLLALVQHHPASNQELKARSESLLTRFKLQVQPKVMAAARERGQAADLAATVQALLTDLPRLDLPPDTSATPAEAGPPDPNQALIEPLTGREFEVLQLLAAGLSNQEIADRLMVATGTVKAHTSQIYGKLQVRNRNRAVLLARELKLI